MYSAAIIGVSGYGGGELVRLLTQHPQINLTYAASETYAGKPLAKAFPGLAGTASGKLICQHGNATEAAQAADIVFLAQESGAAMKSAGEILAQGKRIIDLSADFRLKDTAEYEKWYKQPHTAGSLLAESAVYGLVELHRSEIGEAKLIANPGCYTTASILALAPLLAKKLIAPRGIVVDAKSGISGAGRAKNDLFYKFSEANESVKPYSVGGVHRHIPEIEQEISLYSAPEKATIAFTPHLIPMTRGILATCYAPLIDPTTTDEVLDAFHSFYTDAPFVVVREKGDFPATKDTYASNFCHIGATVDTRANMVIVTSAIDNLVKGAAGQAVQNMNLMLGLPETVGLEGGGLWP